MRILAKVGITILIVVLLVFNLVGILTTAYLPNQRSLLSSLRKVWS